MALALDWPERVDRLVLIATSLRAAGRRWLVRAGMLVADLPVLRGRDRQPRHAMKAQFDATTRFDCTSRLGQIGAPSLIVHGRSDHIAPAALAEQMAALIPHCRLVLIDGGHLAPLLTQHRRLVSEINAFLTAGPLAEQRMTAHPPSLLTERDPLMYRADHPTATRADLVDRVPWSDRGGAAPDTRL